MNNIMPNLSLIYVENDVMISNNYKNVGNSAEKHTNETQFRTTISEIPIPSPKTEYYPHEDKTENILLSFDSIDTFALSDLKNIALEYNLSLDSFNLTSGNYSLDDTLTPEGLFLLPWYMQLFWHVMFGIMVIVAAGGNLIVIYIVLSDRKMRTVTNIFLVNLSIADAMNATLNVIFNFNYMLRMDWPFINVYCTIVEFISVLSISASVFTLMAISFDR